ncbi:MAG: helix-turn-helix domain-containing protein [Thermostichus sp. BF3_bins_97]
MPTMMPVKLQQESRQVFSQFIAQASVVQQINQLFAEFAEGSPQTEEVTPGSSGRWTWDLKSNTIDYSAEWKALLGCREGEIGDSPVEWLHRIHREDLEGVRCALTSYLSGKTARFACEHRLLRRDGTYCWVRVEGQAYRDAEGRIETLRGEWVDMTASRQVPVANRPDGYNPTRPTLTSVFQFIETHYRDPISLREVAQAVGYSAAYLTHLIQQETGHTVNQWIVEYRMAEARLLLLKTDYPIYRIAIAVGYQGSEQFIRQFRQAHQVTPKVWRDTHRSQSLAS